jgi:hypothetical protein
MKETTNQLINRDRFVFYKSYRDTYYQLPVKERAEFIETLMDIYFLNKKIEDITPSTVSLKIVFASISHSISTSIHGLFDKLKIDYNTYPWQGGSVGGYQGGSDGVKDNIQHTTDNIQHTTNNIQYVPEFDLPWFYYPSNRRTQKEQCYKLWKQIPLDKRDVFYKQTVNYISENTKENYKFVKESIRWFRDWKTIIEIPTIVETKSILGGKW